MELVAVDLGGTHARFAVATVTDGRVTALDREIIVKTAEHPSLQMAWEAFEAQLGRAAPRRAAIAVAAPVDPGAPIRMTNCPWVIRPPELKARLGLDSLIFLNDFAAVAHGVGAMGAEHLTHLCGPDVPLPEAGVVSVIGPGTGLGVAVLLRAADGARVIATEGGHIDFAPIDSIDEAILAMLRKRHRRVSVERVVSGPALPDIHAVLAGLQGRAVPIEDDKALWARALAGGDSLATAALDRFCMCLGSVAGDLALAHGAGAVVVTGGLGQRIAGWLPHSGFRERFVAKGRFEARMAGLPVKLVTYPQPGLLGAAAAFGAS